MASTPAFNPVERRFLNANDDWLRFAAQKQARLLLWQVNEADNALLQTYFQVQEESACSVFQFDTVFEKAEPYTESLISTVIEFYHLRREGSAAAGITADWQPPERENTLSPLDYFFLMIGSLLKHHPTIFPGYVFVFLPCFVSSAQKWADYLDTFLCHLLAHPWLSDFVRLATYGELPDEAIALSQKYPETVFHLQGKYKVEGVAREMVAESTERGPGADFRRLFIALTETLPANDPKRLERLRAEALAISEQQQWYDQSVVVHLIAGSAYLKWQDHDKSIEAYRLATDAGKKALAADHPAGNKLVANGLFGEASVHLTQKAFAKAAACYEQAAPFTSAAEDWVLMVEAWRMSAYCWREINHFTAAWEAAFSALRAGLNMEAKMRRNSSLLVAAQWMYRNYPRFESDYSSMTELFAELFGEEWSDIVESDITQKKDSSAQASV